MVVKGAGGKIAASGNGGHLDAEQAFVAQLLASGFDKQLFAFCQRLFAPAPCLDHSRYLL